MTTPDTDKMADRLDGLEAGTEEARRKAQEHGTLPSSEPHQTLVDPDGDGRTDDSDENPGEMFAS